MRAQVLVKRRYRDPQAVTAEVTLRDRLGIGNTISGLERAVYYELELPGDGAAAQKALRRVMVETTLLANPNKEVARAETSPEGLRIRGVGILVWDRNGPRARALEDRIRRELPDLGPLEACSAVLWTPGFTAPADQWDALAARVAGAGTRTGGLLANPHAQLFAVLSGSIPAGFLFDPRPFTPGRTPDVTDGA